MLTKEKIKEVAKLEGLTEDQISAIEKLSKNDEQTTIDENRSEWWQGIDNDIKEVFGLDKSPGIKTYQHLKKVLTDSEKKSASAKKLEEDIAAKDEQIKTLNDQVKKGGGDEALKKQIQSLEEERDSLKNEVTSTKDMYKQAEEDYQKKLSERDHKSLLTDLGMQYAKALSNPDNSIKFLDTIPEATRKRELKHVEAAVLQRGKPEYVDDGSGNLTLVFKNEDGTVLKNKAKGLEPYTPQDLYLEELQKSGILAKGKKATGTGTGKVKGGDNGSFSVDVTEATSQTQAIEIIQRGVLENGISKVSPEFNKEVQRIAQENDVFALPE